jgi:hypothetical protein
MPELARRFPELRELPPAERPDVMFARLFGAVLAPPMLDGLLPAARAWRPDLVISEQAELAGPIAAAALGVPNAAHAFGRLLPEKRVAAATEFVAPLWAAQGLEPRPYAGTYDHLYVDIYPPSLQVAETGHLPDVQLARPVAFAGAGETGPDPGGDGDDPLVYVTFGTVFNTDLTPIATTVEALRDLDVRVVATVGPGRDPADVGPQPPNVHVASYIDQTQLLPRCAAVASHAGSGTFLAALALGLPQLLLPQAADQFGNAAAGAQAGAGIAIMPDDLTVENVRDAARRLLADEAFAQAAARAAQEIRAMPAPELVAERIAARFSAR